MIYAVMCGLATSIAHHCYNMCRHGKVSRTRICLFLGDFVVMLIISTSTSFLLIHVVLIFAND